MGLFSRKRIAPFAGALLGLHGTLFDTARLRRQAWWSVLSRRGLKRSDYDPDLHAGMMGEDYVGAVMRTFGIEEPMADFEEEWEREALPLIEAHAEPRPGAKRLVKDLKKMHVRLAVVTTDRTVTVQNLLGKHGLAKHFEFVMTRDACDIYRYAGPPAPMLYLAAAHHMGVVPGLQLALTSTPNGIIAARTAGCRSVIGVADPPERSEEAVEAAEAALTRAGAHIAFTDLEEFVLEDYLSSL